MPMLKQCSWHGCTKIINDGVSYCEYHQDKYDKEQKKRFKEYKLRREDDKENSFYNSDSWKRLRASVTAMYFYIDILEYYSTGRIIQGENLHHIIEVKEDWARRLDIDNLIYLSSGNHRRVHAYYNKGIKERKQMQKVLFGLVERFVEEFSL